MYICKNVRFVHEHLLQAGLAKSEIRTTHTNIQTTEVKSSFTSDWLAIYQGAAELLDIDEVCGETSPGIQRVEKKCKFKPLWDPFMRRTNCKPTKKGHACNKPCLNHPVVGCLTPQHDEKIGFTQAVQGTQRAKR